MIDAKALSGVQGTHLDGGDWVNPKLDDISYEMIDISILFNIQTVHIVVTQHDIVRG